MTSWSPFPPIPPRELTERKYMWLAKNCMNAELAQAIFRERDIIDAWWKQMIVAGWQIAGLGAFLCLAAVIAAVDAEYSRFWLGATALTFAVTVIQSFFTWRRSLERRVHWDKLSNQAEAIRMASRYQSGEITQEEGWDLLEAYEPPKLPK